MTTIRLALLLPAALALAACEEGVPRATERPASTPVVAVAPVSADATATATPSDPATAAGRGVPVG